MGAVPADGTALKAASHNVADNSQPDTGLSLHLRSYAGTFLRETTDAPCFLRLPTG